MRTFQCSLRRFIGLAMLLSAVTVAWITLCIIRYENRIARELQWDVLTIILDDGWRGRIVSAHATTTEQSQVLLSRIDALPKRRSAAFAGAQSNEEVSLKRVLSGRKLDDVVRDNTRITEQGARAICEKVGWAGNVRMSDEWLAETIRRLPRTLETPYDPLLVIRTLDCCKSLGFRRVVRVLREIGADECADRLSAMVIVQVMAGYPRSPVSVDVLLDAIRTGHAIKGGEPLGEGRLPAGPAAAYVKNGIPFVIVEHLGDGVLIPGNYDASYSAGVFADALEAIEARTDLAIDFADSDMIEAAGVVAEWAIEDGYPRKDVSQQIARQVWILLGKPEDSAPRDLPALQQWLNGRKAHWNRDERRFHLRQPRADSP